MDTDAVRSVALLGALGVGGYLVYQHVYLPAREQELREQQMKLALQQEMARRAAQGQDPLAALGSAACQAVGMYYKIPPQLSAGICRQVGSAASDTVRMLPGYASDYVKDVISPVYKETKGMVTGVTSGISSAVKDVTHLFTSFF